MYSLDSDACILCQPEYFLNTQSKCLRLPMGLEGCEEYLTEEKCRQCEPDFYLS